MSSAAAARRSEVVKPSVKRRCTGSADPVPQRRPGSRHSFARLVAARSSQPSAACWRACERCWNQLSASAMAPGEPPCAAARRAGMISGAHHPASRRRHAGPHRRGKAGVHGDQVISCSLLAGGRRQHRRGRSADRCARSLHASRHGIGRARPAASGAWLPNSASSRAVTFPPPASPRQRRRTSSQRQHLAQRRRTVGHRVFERLLGQARSCLQPLEPDSAEDDTHRDAVIDLFFAPRGARCRMAEHPFGQFACGGVIACEVARLGTKRSATNIVSGSRDRRATPTRALGMGRGREIGTLVSAATVDTQALPPRASFHRSARPVERRGRGLGLRPAATWRKAAAPDVQPRVVSAGQFGRPATA